MWIWRGSLLGGSRAVALGGRDDQGGDFRRCPEPDHQGHGDRPTEATRRPYALCDVGHRAGGVPISLTLR
jgi:hypothetical protein